MKTSLLALGCSWLFAAAPVQAGTRTILEKNPVAPEEPVPLDVVTLDSSYVFSSELEFTHKGIGKGDALRNDFEFIRRIPIQGNWYFQIGGNYNRLDFGGSSTDILPSKLQAFDFPIGISYITQGHVGFLAQVRPGFYFESEVTKGAFNIPFEIGGFFPIVSEKLYGVWGLGTSNLRHYPVIPTVGIIWVIRDNFRLMGYLPEPKLVYDLCDGFSVWAGGEIIASSYKVGLRDDPKLSNTVVDYYEYRAGAGFTFKPMKHWEVNCAAGYAFDRTFDFWRASKSYTADAAPYIKLQIAGEF